MNNTSSDGLPYNSVNISGYHYLLGISAGIVILLTSVIIASYFCKIGRVPFNSQGLPQHTSSPTSQIHRIRAVGLDAATIKSYPKLLYSEVKLCGTCTNPIAFTSTGCCSICLADYDNNDTIRLLPYCGHFFHVQCVDPWLIQRPTCPICRLSSPEHVCETGTLEISMV
ncbi:hypothetical protein MKW98_020924 [Papaver atlanticum]|uniref:RING-type domain-containing protein n=1 Tax=Papaver atlanticum TaxID=357466 RepID=A0AAD4XVH1_9MAGN|nr:hypothetical protein MKW98_020924 [Papaver atlanticum]